MVALIASIHYLVDFSLRLVNLALLSSRNSVVPNDILTVTKVKGEMMYHNQNAS